MNDEHLHQDVERKFIVRHPLPTLAGLTCIGIRSGYIRDVDQQNFLRIVEEERFITAGNQVQKNPKRFFMIAKQGEGLFRLEMKTEIGEETFKFQWPNLHSKMTKKRYILPFGDTDIRLDIFEGDLSGLMMAEVRFPYHDSDSPSAKIQYLRKACDFVPPDWFGAEVTDSPQFSGPNLAKVKNISELRLFG